MGVLERQRTKRILSDTFLFVRSIGKPNFLYAAGTVPTDAPSSLAGEGISAGYRSPIRVRGNAPRLECRDKPLTRLRCSASKAPSPARGEGCIRRATSHQFRRSVMNQPKTHPADQLRAHGLGIANISLGLAQRAYIGSEGDDPAQHQSNRSERRRQTRPEKAKDHNEQQRETAGDRNLGRQNKLPASLGNLGKRLDPRFDG